MEKWSTRKLGKLGMSDDGSCYGHGVGYVTPEHSFSIN